MGSLGSSSTSMESSTMVRTMLILMLIAMSVQQCNARPGPYIHMEEQLKELATQQGEKEIDVHDQNKNDDGGSMFGGLNSKPLGYVFSLLPKGIPIPPSGPSKGHNSIPNANQPHSSNSDP